MQRSSLSSGVVNEFFDPLREGVISQASEGFFDDVLRELAAAGRKVARVGEKSHAAEHVAKLVPEAIALDLEDACRAAN